MPSARCQSPSRFPCGRRSRAADAARIRPARVWDSSFSAGSTRYSSRGSIEASMRCHSSSVPASTRGSEPAGVDDPLQELLRARLARARRRSAAGGPARGSRRRRGSRRGRDVAGEAHLVGGDRPSSSRPRRARGSRRAPRRRARGRGRSSPRRAAAAPAASRGRGRSRRAAAGRRRAGRGTRPACRRGRSGRAAPAPAPRPRRATARAPCAARA